MKVIERIRIGVLGAAFFAAHIGMAAGATPEELTAHGKKLEGQYAGQLEILQAEVEKALPKIDNQKMDAHLKAAEAVSAANSHLKGCQAALGKNGSANGLLGHRKKWMAEATGGVAHWKAKLKEAEAMTGEGKAEAVKAAQAALKVQQDGYKTVTIELKKAQDLVKKAELEKPKLTKDVESARTALELARKRAMAAFKELGLTKFLQSDTLDAKLSKYVVMMEATPRGLAAFAQQGADQKKLIDDLLADESLLLQIVMADGAKDGKYGAAMTIYSAIQKVSPKSQKGCLQRLALAVALEHAVPLAQGNAAAKKDAPKTVDPVKRYLHYEKAYLGKELDPVFKDLTVWEYRMVVDGRQPDEIIAWGREMLRSYRPDHITNPDYRWRYVGVVKTDIRYCYGYNKIVRPELQYTQHILMNGGVCGRRAFFGRFALRAFGIPATARPSPGHGALAHWTPDGWVICLGGGWGAGNTRTRYGADVNFLATTQARRSGKEFLRVKRAQWIGDVMGESRTFDLYSGKPEYWYGVSLYTRQAIIEDSKAVALAAVGTDLGEANVSKVKEKIKTVTISDEDRKITVGNDGVITIPAAACSKPTGNTGRIKFMPSNLGGMQLHYSRTGNAETFEYTFNAPEAGTYALTARLVTPSWKQHLQVAANGTKAVDVALPFTVGLWETTQPVEIDLVAGKNVLTFSRAHHEHLKGLTIRDFTLAPVK